MGDGGPVSRLTRGKPPHRGVAILAVMALAVISGCATAVPLPEVDLSAPGWAVWTGQALWKRGPDQPPVAGELIVAARGNGDELVSFSKPPVPIFTARTAGDLWRLDFVERGRAYGGHGKPPKRFVWFSLPAILHGGAAPRRWTVTHPSADTWLLANARSGESIRVVLDR